MNLEVGAVLEGKVTGITKFGAFVALEEGKTGMVHISEITHTFVKDIRDHISDNQIVKVKVINIDKDGKVSLSIKKADASQAPAPAFKPRQRPPAAPRNTTPTQIDFAATRKDSDSLSFEEKMNRFKQDSDEKMHDLKRYMESKRGGFSRRTSNKY